MVQLRLELSRENFLKRIQAQHKQGYQIVFLKHEEQIVSVAGFRITENLSGKFLLIDDFVTDEHARSHGYGDTLFDWFASFAKKENCSSIQLDAGVQKMAAHRFYFRKRMGIYAYRFVLKL